MPNNEKEPEKLIQHIRNQELGLPRAAARSSICWRRLNRLHLAQQGPDPQLEASIQSSEIALSHAERSAGGVRHHKGDAKPRVSATATAISAADV